MGESLTLIALEIKIFRYPKILPHIVYINTWLE